MSDQLWRIDRDGLEHPLRGFGHTLYYVEGHDPETMHQLMAGTLDVIAHSSSSVEAGRAVDASSTARP